MRAFLYVLGCVLMATSAAGMAFLPRLAPTPLAFFVVGAVLSVLIPGSWLLLTATADSWPRPRAGLILTAAGVLAILFGLRDADWLAVGWAIYVTAVGAGVTCISLKGRSHHHDDEDEDDEHSGPVRGPLWRRAGP